jgi:hypothetical protein
MAGKKPIYWLIDLQGQNNRQDMDKIPDNAGPSLRDVSFANPGTWAKRKGSELQDVTQAGNGVFGLKTYRKNDSTNVLRAVRSTDLDVLTSGTWTQIDAAHFTADTKVSSVNFLNRVYHVSESDNLGYETGGTITEVDDGSGGRIRGKSVIVGQNTLFVGGITYRNASTVSEEDRVYYSRFDATNNTPTDELYDSGGNFSDSKRYFSVNGPYKGSFEYQDFTYHFSDTTCYLFDISLEQTVQALRKVFEIGLANPRAITECNGWMIWMDPKGRIWAYGGAGLPIPLSWDIEDDSKGMALINVIDPSELENVCAGTLGNEFFFSVGDITFLGEEINNAVISALITQGLEYVLWGVDSYPVRPVIYENGVEGNTEVLYFGVDGVDDVYKIQSGTNDGSTAISTYAKSKFFDFGRPLHTKIGDEMYVKYRPQSTTETYLRIRYATDGNLNYTQWSDPDGTGDKIGGSSTAITITDRGDDTFRYEWASGDDFLADDKFDVGDYVNFQAENFNSSNNGRFIVTGVGTRYLEVTNASGIAESNKTIGNGWIGRVVLDFGVINMYAADSATNTDQIALIKFPPGLRFRTLSVEVGNDQLGESFEVSGIGFSFTDQTIDIRTEAI